MIILATAAFGTLSAQTSTKKADIHLQQIIDEYSDCCVKVEYDEVGVMYTFQGGVLVGKVLRTMKEEYSDLYGITGAEEGVGTPYGFIDTNGNDGVFLIFEEPNQLEMTIAYNRD